MHGAGKPSTPSTVQIHAISSFCLSRQKRGLALSARWNARELKFYNLVQVLQVSARVQDCSMDFKTWKFLVLRGPSADSHRSLLTLERLKQGTAVQREKLWSLVPLAAVKLMPLLARCRACSFDRINRLFEPVLSQDFLDGSEEELVLWPCESRMPCDDYSAAVTWTQLSQFSISTSLVLPVPCSTCRPLIGWRNALKPFQNKPTLQDLQ